MKKKILLYAAIIVGIAIVAAVGNNIHRHNVVLNLASVLSDQSNTIYTDSDTFFADSNAVGYRINSVKGDLFSLTNNDIDTLNGAQNYVNSTTTDLQTIFRDGYNLDETLGEIHSMVPSCDVSILSMTSNDFDQQLQVLCDCDAEKVRAMKSGDYTDLVTSILNGNVAVGKVEADETTILNQIQQIVSYIKNGGK